MCQKRGQIGGRESLDDSDNTCEGNLLLRVIFGKLMDRWFQICAKLAMYFFHTTCLRSWNIAVLGFVRPPDFPKSGGDLSGRWRLWSAESASWKTRWRRGSRSWKSGKRGRLGVVNLEFQLDDGRRAFVGHCQGWWPAGLLDGTEQVHHSCQLRIWTKANLQDTAVRLHVFLVLDNSIEQKL